APSNYYLAELQQLICKATVFVHAINLLLVVCVNHFTNLFGANSKRTIACDERIELLTSVRDKFSMVRLTNSVKSFGIWSSPAHLVYAISVLFFYVVRRVLWTIMRWGVTICYMALGEPKENKIANNRNLGLAERGNSWVNGGIVVPINRSVRNYSTKVGKDSIKSPNKETISLGMAKLLELTKINTQDHQTMNENVITIIKDVDVLIIAYNKIKNKPGNITAGVNKETLDGINLNYFKKLSDDLGSGRYKFNPTRIVEIPKPKEGTRSLSIGSPREKIVQEAIRIVLEAIFESSFSDFSHGFRPNRSCQTAIWKIRNYFGQNRWYIEVDYQKCFDSIPHDLLINSLKTRINDVKYLELIYKLLRAGYIQNGTYFNSKKGIPQGSVLSPILSNIALSKIDKYLTDYINKFNKGTKRRQNPMYTHLLRKIPECNQFSEKLEIWREINKNPRYISQDEKFKRMNFVRYADDILIGVIGSKEDCKNIRQDLSNFSISLGLSLNMDKTKITNATMDKAYYLGYYIKTTPDEKKPIVISHRKVDDKVVNKRSRNTTRPILMAPTAEIVQKLVEKGYAKHGKLGIPTRVGRLIHEDHRTILQHYLSLGSGLCNYYRLAQNYTTFKARIAYILYYSCVLTLASKLKLKTKKKVINKLGYSLTTYKTVDNKKVKDVEFNPKSFDQIKRIAEHKDFKNITSINDPFEFINSMIYRLPRSKAILESPCFICNSKVDVEMHHVKHLRKINKNNGADYLTRRMINMNRKQIPLCQSCHSKVHSGNYNGPGL
uniref:hypothetical protein n=1 Tax=Schizosaccharomyces osmophilus TaxID=2545709 RepID=UPI00237ABB70